MATALVTGEERPVGNCLGEARLAGEGDAVRSDDADSGRRVTVARPTDDPPRRPDLVCVRQLPDRKPQVPFDPVSSGTVDDSRERRGSDSGVDER